MLYRHSHEGSFETRVGRERQLTAIANQLHELGFRQLQATSLKQKHIKALVDYWQGQNLAPGTSKNRMSCLGWWADRGGHLHLKASWTKGGRERTLPIRTREQRYLELTGWPSPHGGGPSKKT